MQAELQVYFVAASTRIYGEENFAVRRRAADELSSLREPLVLSKSDGTGVAFAICETAREHCPDSLTRKAHALWLE